MSSSVMAASTTVQVVTIFFAVGHQAGIHLASSLLLRICIYLAAGCTVASGIHYLLVVRHRYAHPDAVGRPNSQPASKG